jgi:uncharacterized membrane protein
MCRRREVPFLYHPSVVHFPIALWLTSALFDLLFLRSGDQFHRRASQFLIGLGLLGAVISVILGFVDYRPLVAEGIGPAFVDRHRLHSLFAYGSILVYLVSYIMRRRRADLGRGAIATFMVLGAVLIGAAGYLGDLVRRNM